MTIAILAALAVAVGLTILGYACAAPRSQLFGPALVRGPSSGRRVALTFDDGPASPFTEQILDILRDRRVPATFFVCGQNVDRHPEIVRRIRAEGHTIGNHTYSHPFLYFRGREKIRQEIGRTQDSVERVIGERPGLFRPPYGARWFGLYPVLRERGMRAVLWSDTGYDWKLDAAGAARAVLSRVAPGAVILLHDNHQVGNDRISRFEQWVRDWISPGRRRGNLPPEKVGRANTVMALPEIIDGIRRAGMEFVSVREFLSS